MTAVVGERRAAQVVVQVGVNGPGYVASFVSLGAGLGVGQIETAVYDDPVNVAEGMMKGIWGDEG
jgi:hypothetical protein